jgi:UDP-N-acetylglucosamine acyltransferase
MTLSCNVLIGGHSTIMKGCNLGLGSIVHQFSVIGAYSMLGMGCIVPKSKRIEPGFIYVGNPARMLKMNTIGLQRNGITANILQDFCVRYEEALNRGHA